jgi:tryptophan-rich sensory protein
MNTLLVYFQVMAAMGLTIWSVVFAVAAYKGRLDRVAQTNLVVYLVWVGFMMACYITGVGIFA